MDNARPDGHSLGAAALLGTGVGLGVLALYVAGGLIVANWSLADFLNHLDAGVLAALLVAGGVAVAIFAVPVVAYLRYGLVTPLLILALVVVGWTGFGTVTGVLTGRTVFGLAVYAMYLAPVYFVLYAAGGGTERYLES